MKNFEDKYEYSLAAPSWMLFWTRDRDKKLEEPKMTTWEQEQKLLEQWEERQAQGKALPVAEPIAGPRYTAIQGKTQAEVAVENDKIDDFVCAQQMTDTSQCIMTWNRKPAEFGPGLIDKAAKAIKAGPYPPIVPDPELSRITLEMYNRKDVADPIHAPSLAAVQERFMKMGDELRHDMAFAQAANTTTAMQDFFLKWFGGTTGQKLEQLEGAWSPQQANQAMNDIESVRAQIGSYRQLSDDKQPEIDIQLTSQPVKPVTVPPGWNPPVNSAGTGSLSDALEAIQKKLNAKAGMPDYGSAPIAGFGKKCDCGGEKARTTHSDWCSLNKL